MTVEEIKEQYSMRDVLSKYGIQANRSGMCSCPFHGTDNHPSMKIYKDSFNCFACHENGDIFSFVQKMENCDFKTAFLSLGGTYEREDNKVKKRLIQAKFDRNKTNRVNSDKAQNDFKKLIDKAIAHCEFLIRTEEPFSELWCESQNILPWLQAAWDEKYLNEKDINEIDVIRVCGKIGCFNDSVRRPAN